MVPRLYFVTRKSRYELGPFTLAELRDAHRLGDVEHDDAVRSESGLALGTVTAVIRISERHQPSTSMHRSLTSERRYALITGAIILGLALLIACMIYALKRDAVAPVIADIGAHRQPDPIPDPTPPAKPAVIVPAPGIYPGSVTTFLSPRDPTLALKQTHAGEPNHACTITNSEIPANVLDGRLETKYFNGATDEGLGAGINDGFVVTSADPRVVTAFQLATANDVPERDPLTITIEGSDDLHAGYDLGGGFTLIYAGPTGLDTDPGRNHWGQSVVFANTKSYLSYRVLVTKTRSKTDGTQISEMRLGILPPP